LAQVLQGGDSRSNPSIPAQKEKMILKDNKIHACGTGIRQQREIGCRGKGRTTKVLGAKEREREAAQFF